MQPHSWWTALAAPAGGPTWSVSAQTSASAGRRMSAVAAARGGSVRPSYHIVPLSAQTVTRERSPSQPPPPQCARLEQCCRLAFDDTELDGHHAVPLPPPLLPVFTASGSDADGLPPAEPTQRRCGVAQGTESWVSTTTTGLTASAVACPTFDSQRSAPVSPSWPAPPSDPLPHTTSVAPPSPPNKAGDGNRPAGEDAVGPLDPRTDVSRQGLPPPPQLRKPQLNAGHTEDGTPGQQAAPPVTVYRQQDLSDADFLREAVVGEGSYSIVTAATHLPTGRLFALKEICRGPLRALGLEPQLQREVNLHRRLRHPNIVRLHSYFVTDEYVHLVLEYCAGGTLMQALRRSGEARRERYRRQTAASGRAVGTGAAGVADACDALESHTACNGEQCYFTEATAATYTRHVARALSYLHANGVVHRDLKLENILLDDRGVAMLADFGWSRQLQTTPSTPLDAPHARLANRWGGRAEESRAQTLVTPAATPPRSGNEAASDEALCAATPAPRFTVCGTLDYLSPEMLLGAPHTYQTDVWSLGVVVVEMLTGRPPFYRDTQQDTMRAIKEAAPDLGALPHGAPPIPPETRALVLRMLAKDPEARPTIAEVLNHPWLRKR